MHPIRKILKLAIPLILSTISISILQFVDRMVLSWHSIQEVAAAMPAGALHFALASIIFGSCSFVGTFVSQYIGAKTPHKVGIILGQANIFSLLGSLLFLLFIPLAPYFFQLFNHSVTVLNHEIVYFQILCWTTLPLCICGTWAGFLTGTGRTWPVMIANAVMAIVNIILTPWWVFGGLGIPELGIEGAAWATVVSQCVGALLHLYFAYQAPKVEQYKLKYAFSFEWKIFKYFCFFALPSGFHLLLEIIGFTLFMLFLGNLGDINQAASNLAFQITMFNFMPTIGIGIAISILVGQSMGSNKIELAQTYIRYGRNITLVYTCTFAALYVIIPEMFIFPFEVGSKDPNFPEIYQKTKTLLLFLAAFSIADGLQIIYASALKGAGDTHFVMKFLSLASIFVLILPTYYLVNIAQWSLYLSLIHI